MARGLIDKALRLGEGRQFKEFEQRVSQINGLEPELEKLDDAGLLPKADELRERARADKPESLDDLLPEAFALTREAARRKLGQRHYDVQLIGGQVLNSGAIAEMKTGEGKTLTATTAVFLNTLAGDGVHVVTVNDYLARRDCEWMRPVYEALGVTVDCCAGCAHAVALLGEPLHALERQVELGGETRSEHRGLSRTSAAHDDRWR